VTTKESISKDGCLVGIISDTHGHLRSEATRAFQDVDLIIHAGDIGKPEVLESLKAIAPVHAVRGNMDGLWAHGLPEAEVVEIGEVSLYVIHDAAVIHGHTHAANVERRKGVLYVNPGSAASFKSPATVVLLRIHGSSLEPQVVEL